MGALVKAYDPVAMENCRRSFLNLAWRSDSAPELAEDATPWRCNRLEEPPISWEEVDGA